MCWKTCRCERFNAFGKKNNENENSFKQKKKKKCLILRRLSDRVTNTGPIFFCQLGCYKYHKNDKKEHLFFSQELVR